jgi:hypothetical protein
MISLLSTPHFAKRILLAGILFFPLLTIADDNWPKEIQTGKATVIMYQPQPDSMIGDHLYSRAAFSLTTPKITDPVFGAIWSDSRFSTDRESGTCTIYDIKVLNIRFPGVDTIDPAKVQNFRKILEEAATNWNLEFSLDELKSSLALNKIAAGKSSDFKNEPPAIIYVQQKSVLVLFDGDPVFKEIENSGFKRAINTPFLVLQDLKDKSYYLFGAGYWYKSTDPVRVEWTNIPTPPANVSKFYDEMMKQTEKSGVPAEPAGNKPADKKTVVPKLVIATKPTELIQSVGAPKFATITGTQLLYITNTEDNIFMTIDKNQYYILVSGRWYQSHALTGPWSFVESDKLPPDFARIPEGSEKDIVLASIAGTDAAKEAVMDAQIPQTAAVDRKTAKCEVKYDGDPKFEKIKGTDLARGMNTGSTVLLYKKVYYVCDNAVWFIGKGPVGPWEVATSIPDEFQKIPPDDPSYNVKYVYIYDVQPEIVYIGYTPGYMGCYVYGPTIVYGTGWVYPPFYGPYYYPHPVTYGFGMHYNPWYGWSMGFSMSVGWFTVSVGGPIGYHGGWWGPPMYHPPFHPPYNHYYGARPPSYHGGHNTVNINNSRNTNIYNKRTDGSAKPVRQPSASTLPAKGNKPGNKPTAASDKSRTGATPGTRDVKTTNRPAGQKNNVYTDQKGNVYKNDNGNWQKNNGKSWETAQPKQQARDAQPKAPAQSGSFNRQEMDRQSQSRDRGAMNTNNRSSMQNSMPARSGGGGMRGGGGRRR